MSASQSSAGATKPGHLVNLPGEFFELMDKRALRRFVHHWRAQSLRVLSVALSEPQSLLGDFSRGNLEWCASRLRLVAPHVEDLEQRAAVVRLADVLDFTRAKLAESAPAAEGDQP